MRILIAICLSLSLVFSACQHKQKHFYVHSITAKFRTDDSFKGIVESFKHSESKGGKIILRSQNDQRTGLYFTVKFNNSLALFKPGYQIKVTFITNLSTKEQSYTWIFPNVHHSLIFQNELYLGLTHDPQFSSTTQLIAWRIEIFDQYNQLISSKHSFAW